MTDPTTTLTVWKDDAGVRHFGTMLEGEVEHGEFLDETGKPAGWLSSVMARAHGERIRMFVERVSK